MIWIMLGVMFLLLFLGFPIMIPLIVAPLLIAIIYFPDLNLMVFIQQFSPWHPDVCAAGCSNVHFAADIMAKGKTSSRLLDFVGAFIGHIRGGYAVTTAAACTLFGSISGSTQATVVAVGKPTRERMIKEGYKDSQAIPLIINASDLALIIPPSIAMIVYGVVTGTSVGELFIAGICQGLLFSRCSLYTVSFWLVKMISGELRSRLGNNVGRPFEKQYCHSVFRLSSSVVFIQESLVRRKRQRFPSLTHSF